MTTEEQAEQILKHFAIGLLEQAEEISNDIHRPVTALNSFIQRGWDLLTALYFERGSVPPAHLPDLVELLHQPVETWDQIGKHHKNLGYTGSLLEWGKPSDLCLHLGGGLADAYNPRLELEDEAFKKIYEHCDKYNLTEEYSRAREFFHRNVIIDNITKTLMTDATWNDEIRKLLKRCYEPVPANCRRTIDGEDYIFLCPYCGWTLRWRNEDAYCHTGSICEQLSGTLSRHATKISYHDRMMRTTDGIQRYVVFPEIELINIYDKLTEEYNLECRLWPEIDSYDIYIRLPSGYIFAADMKDVSPVNLRDLADNARDFNRMPAWNVAYYIFPNYRANPSYLSMFDEYWNPNPQLNLKRDKTSRFIKNIIKEISDEND